MYRLIVKLIFWSSLIIVALLNGFFVISKEINYLIYVFITCLCGISFLILRPPIIKEKYGQKESFNLNSVDNSDVWLLISNKTLYTPWYNSVTKEIGPIRLIKDINGNKKPRLMILPQHSSLTNSQVIVMKKWINDGTSVILECPDSKLSMLTGLHPINKKHHCSYEYFVNKKVDLKGAQCQQYINTSKQNRNKVPNSIIHEKKIGKGFVFSIAIEYGKWAKKVTQGKSNKSKDRFFKKLSWDLQGIQTNDLSNEQTKSFSFTPILDNFEQVLFKYIRDKLRIPSWWYYPDSKKFAFILSFDEDWYGNKIKRFHMPKIQSTWFIVSNSNIDKETVEYIQKKKGTIQLHWNRFKIHLNKYGWHICYQKLIEQKEKLFKKTKVNTEFCRIHYLRWDSDFLNFFYIMEDAGIKFDSSFGPGRFQHGYRFGTGFPYYVCDKKDNPINVQEIPFQIHEPMGGANYEDHKRLIDEALQKYHTCIVSLFHPYYCIPGKKSFRSYKKLLDYLNDLPVWSINLETFTKFWDCRRITELESFVDKDMLLIKLTDLKYNKMTLRLPNKENIISISLNDREIPVNDKIILGLGNHEVKVKYIKYYYE